MTKIQPTTTLTVDDVTYAVTNLSADVQQMITLLDEWRQEEVEQTNALIKTKAALRDIQNTIYSTIQQKKEEE